MLDRANRLDGRTAVLAAAGDNPYTRMTTEGVAVTGYQVEGTVAWLGQGPFGPVACAVGDADQAARLFIDLAAEDRLDGIRWLHLPRVDGRTRGWVSSPGSRSLQRGGGAGWARRSPPR